MLNKVKYILDIPKTIYFNFRLLPLKEAIRLPFFVGHSYKIHVADKNSIKIRAPKLKRFMIRFANGGSIDIAPNKYGIISLEKGSVINFFGDCQFNAGCAIRVNSGGVLNIGNNVHANRNCNISVSSSVAIKDNVLFGFHCSVRDSDGHSIIRHGIEKEKSLPIEIGEQCWICGNVSILKGSHIGKECVVGANSLVSGNFQNHSLIVGTPAKVIDDDVSWKL